MTYYIKVPGAEYFSKPCESIEYARLYAIQNYDKMAVKDFIFKGYRFKWCVPIYQSSSAQTPYGLVIGADSWYFVTIKNGLVNPRKIVRNGKLQR